MSHTPILHHTELRSQPSFPSTNKIVPIANSILSSKNNPSRSSAQTLSPSTPLPYSLKHLPAPASAPPPPLNPNPKSKSKSKSIPTPNPAPNRTTDSEHATHPTYRNHPHLLSIPAIPTKPTPTKSTNIKPVPITMNHQ